LDRVTGLTPRSDFYKILKNVDNYYTSNVESLVYSIYGQTGIGKTTVLYQLIAALLETSQFPDQSTDFDIASSVSPRQILYIPLEESLYHLERPGNGIQRLTQVIDYFQSRIAPREADKYVFLDDINTLELDDEAKSALIDAIDSETYAFLTGVVPQPLELEEVHNADLISNFDGPNPLLPMKFIDTLETQGIRNSEVVSELAEKLEGFRSKDLTGPSPIKTVRDGLKPVEPDVTIDDTVNALNELYFEHLDSAEKDDLHAAARDYLRKGGVLHQSDNPSIRNELTKSNFLLFLYKELAKYGSIQNPENLHRLSSIAASRAGDELQYTDISDQIGVDRRTIDDYLEVLDRGIAVSESHDYSLRRYRRTRLYLRNPRHLVLLSQRQEHHGFENDEQQNTLNHEFEYKLARTVAFDHAKRLAYYTHTVDVEYAETSTGLVDYILHREGTVLPFVLSYHPFTEDMAQVAASFDPDTGQHTKSGTEELEDIDYEAPYRFIITDSLPKQITEDHDLVTENDGEKLCYLPYWLFLLIC
jgi:predicted AAA+ superfamily ATPase